MASPRATRTESRHDPVNRPAGTSPVFSIEKKTADPNRRYVWVSLATPSDQQGVEYYEWLGYQVEHYGDSGPRPAGVRLKAGEEIVVRGQVLMSIDKKRYQEIVEHGPDGSTGQADADEKEKRLIKRRGEFDPLRGMANLNGRSGAPAVYLSGGDISPLQGELGVG